MTTAVEQKFNFQFYLQNLSPYDEFFMLSYIYTLYFRHHEVSGTLALLL